MTSFAWNAGGCQKNDRRSYTWGELWVVRAWGLPCLPRSFLRPVVSQNPKKNMGRASRHPASSAGGLGVLAPISGESPCESQCENGNRQPPVRVAACHRWGSFGNKLARLGSASDQKMTK